MKLRWARSVTPSSPSGYVINHSLLATNPTANPTTRTTMTTTTAPLNNHFPAELKSILLCSLCSCHGCYALVMDVSPPLKLVPGWGNLYQGAAADDGVLKIEKNLWVVCMNYGEIDDTWIDHDNVSGLTVIAINGAAHAVLSDEIVFAGVDQDMA